MSACNCHSPGAQLMGLCSCPFSESMGLCISLIVCMSFIDFQGSSSTDSCMLVKQQAPSDILSLSVLNRQRIGTRRCAQSWLSCWWAMLTLGMKDPTQQPALTTAHSHGHGQRALMLQPTNLSSCGSLWYKGTKQTVGRDVRGCQVRTENGWDMKSCHQGDALICLLPHQIIGDDIDSPEDSASGFRYQIALGFFKNPILGWSHRHKLPSILTDFCVSAQTRHTTTHPAQPSHGGRAELRAGSICANRVVSSALTSFLSLPFPHMGMWGILTPANLSGSVKHRSFMVFIELWDPYLGSAAEMQSIPYGWPYHWEKNLKSDPFVWLPESHCCIIHDSLLFFRRLILLPSPIRPQTAFIILILYSELNHTVLCSGQ